jgi:hypothetical protein
LDVSIPALNLVSRSVSYFAIVICSCLAVAAAVVFLLASTCAVGSPLGPSPGAGFRIVSGGVALAALAAIFGLAKLIRRFVRDIRED